MKVLISKEYRIVLEVFRGRKNVKFIRLQHNRKLTVESLPLSQFDRLYKINAEFDWERVKRFFINNYDRCGATGAAMGFLKGVI